jgi:hypothetical protein
MAIQRTTLSAWLKANEGADPRSRNHPGTSPGGVAQRLGCTRQAVHKLIQSGTLDAIAVYDGKLLAFYVVTEPSLRAYQQQKSAELAKRLAVLTMG